MSDSLWPHESQHARPPCPSPTPGVYSNSCPSSRWYHPAISFSVIPFPSCPQSLPASGFFLMSQLFTWGGQSIGVSASASVLPMNTQDWSPLGWTGWISLQSRGLSRVFSNTTVQKFNLPLKATACYSYLKEQPCFTCNIQWGVLPKVLRVLFFMPREIPWVMKWGVVRNSEKLVNQQQSSELLFTVTLQWWFMSVRFLGDRETETVSSCRFRLLHRGASSLCFLFWGTTRTEGWCTSPDTS